MSTTIGMRHKFNFGGHNFGESDSSMYHGSYGDVYMPMLFTDTDLWTYMSAPGFGSGFHHGEGNGAYYPITNSEDMPAQRASYSNAYYPSVPNGNMPAHRMSYNGLYYLTLPLKEFTPTLAPDVGIGGYYQREGSIAPP